jgi:hypothetical protein
LVEAAAAVAPAAPDEEETLALATATGGPPAGAPMPWDPWGLAREPPKRLLLKTIKLFIYLKRNRVEKNRNRSQIDVGISLES